MRPKATFSTRTAQLMRLAAMLNEHGLVANGLFFKDLTKVLFWEQSAALVEGPRIWESFRARGGKVGLMFWQQSMGEDVDLIVTPAPAPVVVVPTVPQELVTVRVAVFRPALA